MFLAFNNCTEEVSVLSKIKIEVAYALSDRQYSIHVILKKGSTVEEAIRASRLLEIRQDIDLTKNKVGIYGRIVKLADMVENGDRVEIYRPLITDPRELRRQRDKKRAYSKHFT